MNSHTEASLPVRVDDLLLRLSLRNQPETISSEAAATNNMSEETVKLGVSFLRNNI